MTAAGTTGSAKKSGAEREREVPPRVRLTVCFSQSQRSSRSLRYRNRCTRNFVSQAAQTHFSKESEVKEVVGDKLVVGWDGIAFFGHVVFDRVIALGFLF